MVKTTFSFLLILITVNAALLWYGHVMQLEQFFPAFHLSQFWFTFIGYGIIGLGLSIPMTCLALIFGWLQVILLITGQITPHLKNAGFIESLQLLLSAIL